MPTKVAANRINYCLLLDFLSSFSQKINPVFFNSINKKEKRRFFLTVTQTVGQTAGHTDVSIWCLLLGCSNKLYLFDQEGFNQVCWFTPSDIPYQQSDFHMKRCIEKLSRLNLIQL